MKKFKLVTLLGIRPDYIRMHKLIELLDKHGNVLEHILVHSGQHYDPELFGVFLKELNIRKPEFDLEVGLTLKKRGVSNHAYQVALLSQRVFDLIEKLKPDAVMYLGDTNTILSSVTVARCGVPVIHLEAGGRSFDWRMPEEKNRIVIDHVSDVLYCYLKRYKEVLRSEGIEEFRIKVIGNIIVDALKNFGSRADKSNILQTLGVEEKKFILVTLHREENINKYEIVKQKLLDIVRFAQENKLPIVFPVMPRVRATLKKFSLTSVLDNELVIKTKPLGFLDFLKLEKTARLIISDSGTVQEEAFILGTPCVVARRSTERPETIWAGATILQGFEKKDSLYKKTITAFKMEAHWDSRTVLNPQGGSPSERAYKDLIKKIQSGFFEKSRKYEFIKSNKFVREAYGRKK
ncbi:UDP-N-acetylglucosamine 2-epimerase (non-hydrolyzing) [Patescibacteria group bacterium AH-259-L05]|nr:UDP-N-acetylglucosamine 2-epimerase (non-hydrolyzing) [Patescibacteria group bacterium AH-259-L05]